MKFLCVCLAPAIDATVRLNAWPKDGCVIKNALDTFAPGGKTINVARWLAKRAAESVTIDDCQLTSAGGVGCGVPVVCTGLLGEDNAVMFEKELKQYGIEDRFVRVHGATRVNEMFVTSEGSFKVNRPAFPGVGNADALVVEVLRRLGIGRGDVAIISGSLPAGWPSDTYRVMVEKAKAMGATVVLDASGAALTEGVKALPDVIKPNAEECEALIGFQPKTPEEFKRATEALRKWAEYPIISDGGAGCWFNGEFVAAPEVEVLDTTAAGDTLLAEWCWRKWGDAAPGATSAGAWAVAAGSAACTMNGGTPPPIELVERLARVE